MNGPAIVVIEGVDRTGKTTLAEQIIVEATEAGRQSTLVHFGTPEGNPFESYREALAIAANNRDGVTVFDRLHWSSIAYQSVYADKPAAPGLEPPQMPSEKELAYLEDLCFKNGVVFIHKTRPFEGVEHDLREEDYQEPGDASRLAAYFKRSAAETRCRVIEIPFDTVLTDEDRKIIIRTRRDALTDRRAR